MASQYSVSFHLHQINFLSGTKSCISLLEFFQSGVPTVVQWVKDPTAATRVFVEVGVQSLAWPSGLRIHHGHPVLRAPVVARVRSPAPGTCSGAAKSEKQILNWGERDSCIVQRTHHFLFHVTALWRQFMQPMSPLVKGTIPCLLVYSEPNNHHHD